MKEQIHKGHGTGNGKLVHATNEANATNEVDPNEANATNEVDPNEVDPNATNEVDSNEIDANEANKNTKI